MRILQILHAFFVYFQIIATSDGEIHQEQLPIGRGKEGKRKKSVDCVSNNAISPGKHLSTASGNESATSRTSNSGSGK